MSKGFVIAELCARCSKDCKIEVISEKMVVEYCPKFKASKEK